MVKYLYEVLVRFQPDGTAGAHREYRDTEDPNYVEVTPLDTADFPARVKTKMDSIFGAGNVDLLNTLAVQSEKLASYTTASEVDPAAVDAETAALATPSLTMAGEITTFAALPEPEPEPEPVPAKKNSVLSILTFGLLG